MARKGTKSVALILAFLMVALASLPSLATVKQGGGAFICEAHYPVYPAVVVTQGGTCDGTITLGGDIGSGNSKGTPLWANLCAPTCDFHADMNYIQICVGIHAIGETATGNADITGATSLKGDPAKPISTSSVSVNFSWTRIGAAIVAVIGGSTKYQEKPKKKMWSDGKRKNYVTAAGIAVGKWVPGGVPPTCLAPAPFRATVFGGIVWTAVGNS